MHTSGLADKNTSSIHYAICQIAIATSVNKRGDIIAAQHSAAREEERNICLKKQKQS